MNEIKKLTPLEQQRLIGRVDAIASLRRNFDNILNCMGGVSGVLGMTPEQREALSDLFASMIDTVFESSGNELAVQFRRTVVDDKSGVSTCQLKASSVEFRKSLDRFKTFEV